MKHTFKGLLKKQLVIMLTVTLALGQTPLGAFAAETKTVSEAAVSGITVSSENGGAEEENADGAVSENTVSDDTVTGNDDAGDATAEETVSDNKGPEDTVSDNGEPEDTVSENSVSDDAVDGEDPHKRLRGFIPDNRPTPPSVLNDPDGDGEENAKSAYPASFNPKDSFPSTRSQKYGTCWTYGTQAMVEGDLIRSGYADKSIDTSELHVAYFSNWSNYNITDPLGGTEGDTITYNGSEGYLDEGGNYDMSLQGLANWSGSVNENDVTHENDAKTNTKLDPEDQYLKDKFHVQGVYVFPTADIETMKKYIYENGAVGIAFASRYENNFYDSKNNSFYCNTSTYTDHAVSVIGWDDNFSASKFKYKPEGDGAWLVRNSWTTTGEYSFYGYFWMSYYDKSLHNASYAVDAEPKSNYQNNYQYDGDTLFSMTGVGGTNVIYGANIFEVAANGSNNERLDAVSFETCNTANADYDIYVYRDITDGSDPESGTLCAIATGKTEADGYYTVKLENPVELKAGSKFSVVVKLSKDKAEDGVFIAREFNQTTYGSKQRTIASKANQSFYRYSESGSFTTTGTSGNIRIKAFTNNLNSSGEPVDPGEGGLLAIKLQTTRDTIKIGQSTTITASPLPKKADLGTLTWTSSDPQIATVDANGKVTGVAGGEAEIKAKSGNVTAKIKITVLENCITNIRLDRTALQMDIGDELSLIADVTPVELAGNVTWSTSDNSVATVDSKGKIKALAKGVTVVTVTAKDKSAKSASCEVTVLASNVIAEDEKLPEKSGTDLWLGGIADCYYTGEALKPYFNVYDGQRMLYYGSDYTVKYTNNKIPATKDSAKAPTATVKFKGNYSGTLTRTFNILPAPLSESVIAENMAESYTGKKIDLKPVVINRYSGVQLKAGRDFDFKVTKSGGSSVDEIVEKGEYTVKLEPGSNGYYAGNLSVSLTVASDLTDVNKFKVKVDNTTYTEYPEDVKPIYTVTYGKDSVSKTKYVISSNSIVINDKGMASVLMTGVPARKTCGTRVIRFKVTPAQVKLTKSNCEAYGGSDFVYTKGGLKPQIWLILNKKTYLFQGSELSVSYKNYNKVYEKDGSRDPKAPRITVKGKGRYKGTLNYWYSIYQKDISTLDIRVSDVPISGSRNFYSKPKVTIIDDNGKKLSQGSDFSVAVEKPGERPGVGDELYISITGKGNYKGKVDDRSFKIIEADKNLAKAKITLTGNYTYTRREIRPTDIRVTLNGQEVDSSCYYVVGYDKNTSKGNASITIRGKNGYGGYKTQKFKINAKPAK